MSDIHLYFLLALLVFQVNIIPFFMPPTWIVLAFFHNYFELSLIPTVIIGASMATAGRIVLALTARRFFSHRLPNRSKQNLALVAKFIRQKRHFSIALMFFYAFLPIPSNQAFIALGLAKADLRLFALAFFIGRLISYTFWVLVSIPVSDNIQNIFAEHLTSWPSLLAELATLGLFIWISQWDFPKIWHYLKRQVAKIGKGA